MLGDRLIETGESLQTHLLISHSHWDHIQGFPFFKPAFISGNEITVVGSEPEGITLRRVIADQMNKIYFPIQINELKARINFRPVGEETLQIHGATVQTLFMNHPALALGYRINYQGKSLVYISDNEPFDREVAHQMTNVDASVLKLYQAGNGDPNKRVFEFVKNADILIHDATYTPEEYIDKVGWGHSHYLFTLRVAHEGEVKKLVLFHHEQTHTDERVADIERKCQREISRRQYSFQCVAAAEGMEMEW
jgi:phosphoribosyl 1,2-cyclic phosphodiesterase